jgi:gamma-glutamylcyclotransferase (GGCT)/AIG2-like uncharacterized protein YtfP
MDPPIAASHPPASLTPAPKLQGQVLYFDYGTGMRRAAFPELCPGADCLGVARLEGYRLAIAWHGHAAAQPDTNATVFGVLWLVPAASLPALDVDKQVSAGHFARTTVRVVTPAGPQVESMLYLPPKSGLGAPQPGHLAEILAGAKENKLPPAYLKRIDRLAKNA